MKAKANEIEGRRKMKDRRPTAVDLFAGAGGFSLGMRQAGFRILVAVENDKWAAQTYRANQKGTIVIEEDIRELTAGRLLRIAKVRKGELTLLFGGPPCKGFSFANANRSLDNPNSKLMSEFVRMVKGVQPRGFYIENVPGLLAFKDFFILLMECLENCGYTTRCLMMDACSYMVPQHRKRVFIQGTRKDLDILPVFPPPTHFDPEQLKVKDGQMFQPAMVAVKCFANNGFSKEEVKDLYWNNKLSIQMNRKTAVYVWECAIGELIGEGIKAVL